jgi:hypothetical protein
MQAGFDRLDFRSSRTKKASGGDFFASSGGGFFVQWRQQPLHQSDKTAAAKSI